MDPFFSNFGNPWEMGTGFAQPQSFMPGTMNQPVMPQMDLPSMFANGLAAQGIRPQQFFQNPEAAMQSIMPSPEQPNVWDPTPVPGSPQPPMMPGGNNYAGAGNSPNLQADDAQAGGASRDMKTAKEGTIADRLVAGLRGMQGPTAPPQPQMMQAARAPAPPDARGRVEAGELLKLLLAANAGPATRALPPTLGAALQGIAR